MDRDTIVYLTFAIATFYFGDLITTYLALSSGYEANILLAQSGFMGTVLLKSVFITVFILYFIYLKNRKKEMECGMLIGAVIAIGLFTIFYNLGFFVFLR